MSGCERYETLVSAWQDQELARDGQVEMLDHLVRCDRCRDFYLAVRGLSGLVAVLEDSEAAGARENPRARAVPAAGESPFPEVWHRIQQSLRRRGSLGGGLARRLQEAFRPPVPAAAAAAAFVVLFLVAVFTLPPPPGGSRPSGVSGIGVAEIRIGGNPEAMDDARFMEVTRLVLGADRRYRDAFYEVLRQVVQDTERDHRFTDRASREEGEADREPPETVRGPSRGASATD